MKNARLFSFLLATSLFSMPAFAAGAKTYQVTGPVLEVSDATVTVQKGKETWQIDRTKDTKVTGDLKVGAKVTIQYRMTAETIEAKGGGKDAKAADAKAMPADAKAGPGPAATKAPEPAKK